MAVCFGLFWRPWRLGLAAAFIALVVSDLLIATLAMQQDPALSFGAWIFSPAVLLRYVAYGLILAMVWRFRERASAPWALALTPCASLGFYVFMNTVSWATSPAPWAYAKTLAGWWQSQTVGLPIPGAPPSILFLRNAMIGDLVFSLLFITLILWLPQRRSAGVSSTRLLEEAR
jgi:hypothetical protein